MLAGDLQYQRTEPTSHCFTVGAMYVFKEDMSKQPMTWLATATLMFGWACAGRDSGGSGASGASGTGVAGGASGRSGGSPGTGGADRGSGGAGQAGMSSASGGSGDDAGLGGTSGSGGSASIDGGAGTSGTGGVAGSGGASGGAGAGGSGVTCQLPATFKWTSTGPLASPKSPAGHNFVSLKDFTVSRFNDQFVVYATVFDSTASWSGVSFNFIDWAQADAAPQTYLGSTPLGGTVAPTLFYFTPKNLWVITYQWGFKYATTTDPTRPSTWSSPKALLIGDPTTGMGGTGPIDQTVICDGTSCYLFFAGDNGHIYRASMPIGNFPSAFTNATSIMSDTQANLFEAVQVYSVKGTGQYLMIVEAMGSGGRYFRAFTANSLGGTFAAIPGASTQATPFAGKSNVTFSGSAWTNDISHGDIVRNDPAETMPIDACNLQFLYQGFDKTVSAGDYGLIPYRPALLTLSR